MMTIRALGNLSSGSGGIANAASHYYHAASGDYYAKNEEEINAGFWFGSAAQRLGLSGLVLQDDLQLALSGTVGGLSVQNVGKEDRQIGWDMTFSAPKSVSIAWAFAGHEHRAEIEEAHLASMRAAYDYVESKAITRRGSTGTIKEQAQTIAAGYTHYTSRANDPQLHTHVVVPNFCLREDGTVGAMESISFFENKIAAGALYRAELASRMQELGYEVVPTAKNGFRLSAVHPKLEKLYSKRAVKINSIIEKLGVSTYEGSRQIVLNTRPNKTHTSIIEREEYWQNEAEIAGFSTRLLRADKSLVPVRADVKAVLDEAKGRVVRNDSVFREFDAVHAIAVVGVGKLNAAEVLRAFDDSKKNGMSAEVGRDKYNQTMYSTDEMLRVEKSMLSHVESLSRKNVYAVDASYPIKNRPFLSQEQKDSIEAACGAGGIVVVQGRAGTGKTTMLAAINEAYSAQGYRVRGLAFTGQAAQTMQAETSIPSLTISAWQNRQTQLDARTVLVLDEAGMIGSQQMADVLGRASVTGAKVIMVGDERQLQPIAAGGALRAVDECLIKLTPSASSRMEDIKRQRIEWMREAVKDAAQGKTRAALTAFDKRGKVEIHLSPKAARAKLVNDYLAANTAVQKDGIILTNQRSDAIKINKSVRDLLQKSGHVKDDLFTVDNGTRNVALAVGDRVLLTRNDYDIDVRNGQRGMITDAQEKTVTIAMDNGQIRTIDTDVYPNIEYGWASTTYKAQGATTERAYIYCHTKDPMSSQQASYVQISRAREETMIYAVRGERSVERRWNPGTENSLVTKLRQREAAFEDLCTSWSKDAGKETTLDYEKEQTKEIVKEIQHELEM